MSMRNIGVVCCSFVVAGFVMLDGFLVMLGCLFVVSHDVVEEFVLWLLLGLSFVLGSFFFSGIKIELIPLNQWMNLVSIIESCQEFFCALAYITTASLYE